MYFQNIVRLGGILGYRVFSRNTASRTENVRGGGFFAAERFLYPISRPGNILLCTLKVSDSKICSVLNKM